MGPPSNNQENNRFLKDLLRIIHIIKSIHFAVSENKNLRVDADKCDHLLIIKKNIDF